ncbi:tripartite tricarboxylate transporter substrate binding protein [Ottowia caeni]|uniref:Bug family tripartite tricarboxylate transporter substrate binding protein n=1 Tax=Ottowia caeni TaxID=2870339 RepID=UPI001E5A788E|nr:tripartite tricarboxylate transporter substrate binding protein [Ottowia caeni]
MQISKISRRVVLAALSAVPLTVYAAEDKYPSRTATIVVAYAPGGSTDIVARMLANELSKNLGQSVIVDNKGGGGTSIGTQFVKRSPPDGHTLLFGTNAFVISSLLQKNSWDPVKDFEPVGMVTTQSLGVLVRPSLKVKSIPELIAYAKANPDKLNFASSGNGSAQHLAGEAFKRATGITMVHVPYKGAGPAIQDMIGDRVDVMFTSLVGLSEMVKDQKLTLLATTGKQRSPGTPNVPTVAEGGVPGYSVQSWQGLFAPANTPASVINQLQKELVRVSQEGTMAKRLREQGMELSVGTGAELRAHLQQELDSYKTLLQSVNVD